MKVLLKTFIKKYKNNIKTLIHSQISSKIEVLLRTLSKKSQKPMKTLIHSPKQRISKLGGLAWLAGRLAGSSQFLSDPFVTSQILSDPFGSFQMLSDPLRSFQIPSDPLRSSQIPSDPRDPSESFCDGLLAGWLPGWLVLWAGAEQIPLICNQNSIGNQLENALGCLRGDSFKFQL